MPMDASSSIAESMPQSAAGPVVGALGLCAETQARSASDGTTPGTQARSASDGAAAADWPLTVIENRPGWSLNLGELWRYRELLFFLTLRDVKVRYKQTVLGAAWAVLQPLATMVVFSLFFGQVQPNRETSFWYPLFVFAGLVPWTFFANAVLSAGQSIVSNGSLVTKIFFPRLIIPTSAVGVFLLDFAIAFSMLLVLMLCCGVVPGWSVLLLPVVVAGLLLLTLAVGTVLAALTVTYRDFRFVVPFLVQLWMFATPGIYMQADVAGPYGRWVLPMNPAQGLITNFRAALLGGSPDLYALALSSIVTLALALVGCAYFRRVERSFADII
jgi:lipopolysaccharide transport system permease protein